jgi:hypothetical protein
LEKKEYYKLKYMTESPEALLDLSDRTSDIKSPELKPAPWPRREPKPKEPEYPPIPEPSDPEHPSWHSAEQVVIDGSMGRILERRLVAKRRHGVRPRPGIRPINKPH